MAVIALVSAWWAYNTSMADRNRTEARDREQRHRIQEQQIRERRTAQHEAISQMSRQLGLMEAQCDSSKQLRNILDKSYANRREERCYDAYIGARSIFFLSQVRVIRDPSVCQVEWECLWNDLKKSLRNAGSIAYNPAKVSATWKAIVENSKQY